MLEPSDQLPVHHPTVEQWYTETRVRKVESSEPLGWNNINLRISHHDPVRELKYVPYQENDAFAFLIEGKAHVHARTHDGKTYRVSAASGALQLFPRYTEYSGNWDAPWAFGAIVLNRSMVEETIAEIFRGDPARIEMVPTYFFEDPLSYHLGLELSHEMRGLSPLGSLYAESLSNMLTLHLLRKYSTGYAARKLATNRLLPIQIRMIDEYIYAHIDQRISLADLANCLHLSIPHFERMFRATAHRPPYQYVLEIRLENAQMLLKNSRLSVAEVGLQCGFSNQSHFTAHFTRYFGISPARFARKSRE